MRVLAIDPGREKCGVAVCGPEGIVRRQIVPRVELATLVGQWVAQHEVAVVLVGNQTGFQGVVNSLRGLSIPIAPVEERNTTLLARRRYFRDHPPKGWRRLLPLSLQVPAESYDDYAAVVLAEAYLAGFSSKDRAAYTNT